MFGSLQSRRAEWEMLVFMQRLWGTLHVPVDDFRWPEIRGFPRESPTGLSGSAARAFDTILESLHGV